MDTQTQADTVTTTADTTQPTVAIKANPQEHHQSPQRTKPTGHGPAAGQFDPEIVSQFSWAVTESRLGRMRPAELRKGLLAAGLRTKFNGIELPPDACWAGFGDYSPAEIISGMRRRLLSFANNYGDFVRRRLRYFYQVQLCPPELRRRMANYMALTYLPGDVRQLFPKDARLWDLDRIQVMTLNSRLDRPIVSHGGNFNTLTHHDVRVSICELDRENGSILMGGQTMEDGIVRSRCILSRLLSYEPSDLPVAMPRSRFSLVDHALAMHEALEMAVATDVFIEQTLLRVPQILLAFSPNELVQMEPTAPGLQARAFDSVRAWLRLGCPINSDEFGWVPMVNSAEMRAFDPNTLSDWRMIEDFLGKEGALKLLTFIWNHCREEWRGDILIPAKFFDNNSSQKPYQLARKVMLEIEPFLGRACTSRSGDDDYDQRMAAIQIIKLPKPEEPLHDNQGDFQFDFRATELGMEATFE